MNAKNYLPPLRVEIRDVTLDNDGPWFFLTTAQTDKQAEDKIRREKIAETCETRIVPNESISVPPKPAPEDTEETRRLLETLGAENMTHRRVNAALELENETLRKAKAPHKKVETLTPDTPIPFEVGALVRDMHSGHAVRVTEHNPKHRITNNPRKGFAWVSTTKKPGELDHTGFCPVVAMASFVPVDAKETAATS